MNLLVFLDVAADVRIPPERDPRSGRVREDWLVWEVDPGGARALDLALALASHRPNGHVTVIHLGPPEHDVFLRQTLARGCDRAIRIWDDEAAEARTAGKALILAAAAQAAGFDLILSGDRGVIGAGGQVGVLTAAHLGVACVTEVGTATLSTDSRHLEATRELERGFREKVEARLPVVITVAGGGATDGRRPADGDGAGAASALVRTFPYGRSPTWAWLSARRARPTDRSNWSGSAPPPAASSPRSARSDLARVRPHLGTCPRHGAKPGRAAGQAAGRRGGPGGVRGPSGRGLAGPPTVRRRRCCKRPAAGDGAAASRPTGDGLLLEPGDPK